MTVFEVNATVSSGTVVLRLADTPVSEQAVFVVGGLRSGTPYYVRVACNNDDDDRIGVAVPSTPSSVAPQAPQISAIVVPSTTLPGAVQCTVLLPLS